MKTFAVLMALSLAAESPVPAAEDPFAPVTTPSGSIEALVHNAMFGEPGADAAIARWLEAHPKAPAPQRQKAYHQLCNDYGVYSFHAARARVCAAENKRPGHGDDDKGASAAVKDVPPVRAIGSARVPLTWNFFGSESTDVTVKGVTLPWFVDTGAEISVVAKSNADRMGVRYVGSRVQVGTTTADVHGRIGVIDLMRIGDAYVENVPVLVLPDSQLSIAGSPRIPAILGLPVFVAFHRMAWLDDGTTLALGETAPAVLDPSHRIYWHEEGLGIPLVTPQGIQGAHLDTGANRSSLRPAGLGLLSAAERAAAVQKLSRTGGAGGVISRMEQHFPKWSFSVAGRPVSLSNIALDSRPQPSAARIGMDVVSQFRTFVLDFDRMTFSATLKPPGTPEIPHPPLSFAPKASGS